MIYDLAQRMAIIKCYAQDITKLTFQEGLLRMPKFPLGDR
jgi:hypothetical protein